MSKTSEEPAPTTSATAQNGLNDEEAKWERFHNWIHCICVVTFDLEMGQALESVYPPHVHLSKTETSNICYLAFPDSNSGCMGDTCFTVRTQGCPTLAPSVNDTAEQVDRHRSYNAQCPVALQSNANYYWGYVYFRQVKDIALPRGYFQKSVVILSRLPFNNLFGKVVSLIAPEYFDSCAASLESACAAINQWSAPLPGVRSSLRIFDTVFQTYVPHIADSSSLSVSRWNNTSESTLTEPSTERAIVDSLDIPQQRQHVPWVDEMNLFEVLQPVLSHVDMLWELLVTAEPLVIMATSPTHCSSLVLALTRLIAPLKFCADYRPYFTIHDTDFKQFTSKVHGPPPVILGVTNPFFAKTLQHWPHTIRLGENYGTNEKFKLKRNNGNVKILDCSPGVYTTYKPFLQKNKTIIKNIVSGVHSKRPTEVQTVLLRRHLLELTHSFMIPLERYLASLMPLLKNISPFKAAPMPLPFNPDDFFATLETTGPQLTSVFKGDWVGLYKRFFRSPNFNGWFNARYTELALKLQALQLQALSTADLKVWVRDKPEVEVIDMVLKLKAKIYKCQQHEVPVTNSTRHQLTQRLEDIIRSLPDDIKYLFQDS